MKLKTLIFEILIDTIILMFITAFFGLFIYYTSTVLDCTGLFLIYSLIAILFLNKQLNKIKFYINQFKIRD